MESLFGISMSAKGHPTITPHATQNCTDCSFGAACFSDRYFATLLKNMEIPANAENSQSLFDGKHFGGEIFLFDYLRKNGSSRLKNPPPFRGTFEGRDWIIVCKVKMGPDYKRFLMLEEHTFFKPIGESDEEYVACWIFDQIHIKKVTSLSDLRWSALHDLLIKINDQGYIDILITDGQDLVVYHDKNDHNPLYCLQSFFPHVSIDFQFDALNIRLNNPDFLNSFVLFSTEVLKEYHGHQFSLLTSQMIVVRSGLFIWDSYANLIPPVTKPEIVAGVPAIEEHEEPKNISTSNPLILNKTHELSLKMKVSPSDNASAELPVFYITTSSADKNPYIYSILHESHYKYSNVVHFSKHLFRLQPVHDVIQSLLHYKLSISAKGKFCNFYGAFGNAATIFDITEPYSELHIKSEAVVSVVDLPPQRYDLLHQRFTIPLIWMPWDRIMLQAYLSPPELSESELYELSDYAMTFVKRNNNDVIEVLNDINRTIHREFTYMSASTSLATTAFDVYEKKRGVCQDFANLFICLARLLNIPARYRVGYIYTGADYENKIQSEASHAWIEVYIPNVGWIGFDPTNGCPQTKNHIRVASGRYYQDATPTSGTIFKGGGQEHLIAHVKVLRLNEIDRSLFN